MADKKGEKILKRRSRLIITKKSKRKTPKRKPIDKSTLVKPEENPIISPRPENGWEAWQTFNPGVISLDDRIHFLYRAIGKDGISRLGYAMSGDGFTIDERLPNPVYEHKTKEYSFNVFSYFSGGSWGGCEDPRIVQVDEEDTLYMTYTACDEGLRVALTSIKTKDFLNKRWKWKSPVLISPPGEVHKNWVIFPEKINGRYAILHSINPEIQIDYFDSLKFDDGAYVKSFYDNQSRENCWDKWIRGIGPVPIKTKYGWLVFYHAMDSDWSRYRVGAMLLDSRNPTEILCRSPQPVLEPQEPYENCGYKPGIVYVSGAVVKDSNLLVYYGGADNYVCVAYSNLEKFLEALRKESKPRLKQKILTKKK